MKEIIFVTSNDNKAREAQAIIGMHVRRVNLDLDEIQSMDLNEIIDHKVRQAYAKLKKPVLVDDVSLNLKAWNGFPGPFSRFLGEAVGWNNLPKLLKGQKRTAKWICMLGYFDGKKVRTFIGGETGTIATAPRGKDGWGFDLVFIPARQRKTAAELGATFKKTKSARAQALNKVKRYLTTVN